MDKKYWFVKIIIGGFESSICMYGDELSLRDYMQRNFNGPISYVDISEDFAESLMRMSCKVYMIPTVKPKFENADEVTDSTVQ